MPENGLLDRNMWLMFMKLIKLFVANGSTMSVFDMIWHSRINSTKIKYNFMNDTT